MNLTPNYLRRLIVAATSPDDAEAALPWAGALARQLSLPLTFVQVVETVGTSAGDLAEAKAMAQDALQILASDTRLARVEVLTETLVGSADDELARFAQEEVGSVLLLARGGAAPSDAVDARSVERVIQKLMTPFIMLPANVAPPSSIRSVVVGRDHSALAEAVIRLSQTLGLSLNVDVVIVESVEPGTIPVEAFTALVPTISERHLRVRGLASRTLLATARARGADLIVVGAHGAGETRRPALGRTADWLVRHADRPVVVVPETP